MLLETPSDDQILVPIQSARIVGMTPGPDQLKLAYAKIRGAIAAGRPEAGF